MSRARQKKRQCHTHTVGKTAEYQSKYAGVLAYEYQQVRRLFEEEKEFILCDNCIATCNTRSKLPMVMRFNLLTVLILKVMATSFLAQVPYLSVV